MSNYESEALRLLDVGQRAFSSSDGEQALITTLAAQVNATLALVEVQREATDWGKKQVMEMKKAQAELIVSLKELAGD